MTGTVQSGLLPTPTSISNSATSIELAAGNPKYSVFGLGSPVKVVGLQITITATIDMPAGTITNDHILPFAGTVTLTPANATMTYSNGTNSTKLGINGTLTATVTAAAAPGSLMLHAAGAQAVTTHEDGTQLVRSVHGAAVETGAPGDSVVLQFYASGVSDASEVRVQFAGEDMPVLYAGKSGHFPGLDQVSVQIPRSLAWRGEGDIVLTVDGETANPVCIHIQ
jgi:uncharacterized protein (TIGR03437 family)